MDIANARKTLEGQVGRNASTWLALLERPEPPDQPRAEMHGKESVVDAEKEKPNRESRHQKARQHITNKEAALRELKRRIDTALGRISTMRNERDMPPSLKKLQDIYQHLDFHVSAILHRQRASVMAHHENEQDFDHQEHHFEHHDDFHLDRLHHHYNELESKEHTNSFSLGVVSAEHAEDFMNLHTALGAATCDWDPTKRSHHK